MRRFFAALAVALLLVGFGAVRIAAPHATSLASGGPNMICNSMPGPC